MRPRLVLITEIIAPYRVPVFNALAARGDVDLHVVFLSETDSSLRQWRVPKDEIQFSYEVLDSFRRRVGKYNLLLNKGVLGSIEKATPDAIICGGYNYLASWQALRWANRRKIPFLLWTESTGADQRGGHDLIEAMKRRFICNCDGFVVPGKASAAYLGELGIQIDRIFCAPNAVDNDLFAASASRAREDAQATRARLNLPSRYFLDVCRLVPAKGIFELLDAYAKLPDTIREDVGLVFVGDGSAKPELIERASKVVPGEIHFPGFVQKEQLGEYYGLADALVFPTQSDPWGLVVNEAMASGIPVIVSDVLGAQADLAQDGWNGRVVPFHDIDALSSAMKEIAVNETLRAQMAQRGREHIQKYSPETWAAGMASAVAAACGSER